MLSLWSIFVDTGGTFTDCLAIDPRGGHHEAKVLSSGDLRATIETGTDRRLRLEAGWDLDDGFLEGFNLRLLDVEHEPVAITRYDASDRTVTLGAALPVGDPTGRRCSISAGLPAPVLAARLVTRTPLRDPLPDLEMRLGTTYGTNALLERRGAPCALFVTAGHADLLEIGDQQRPRLFALDIEKRRILPAAVVEVEQRCAADGTVLQPLTDAHLDELEATAGRLRRDGIRSAAVALMHSYLDPAHEHRVAARLRAAGMQHVSCSGDLTPLIKLLPRAETAVVEAYLAPVVDDYLRDVAAALGDRRLQVMTSAGGLVGRDAYRACDSLLSGPAGGVVGARAAGRRSGFERIIGFDMGGTSTDVCRCDGDYEYRFEHRVGDARLASPALAIETVAAGGGSVCTFADGRLRVGPESAGAWPGPACYGAGGPLTITDVNLLGGRLDPAHFEIPIVREDAEAALDRLVDAVPDDSGARPDRDALLDGLLRIADERMADAIAAISVARGIDPAGYAMVSFGGAGGQHACAVAGRLGMRAVVMPAAASLLSAAGLREAVIERFAERQVLRPLDESRPRLDRWIGALAEHARAGVVAEGVPAAGVRIRRAMVNLRLLGQESSLAVEATPSVDLAAAFREAYRATYRHEPTGVIEIESIRVVASSAETPAEPVATPARRGVAGAAAIGRVRFEGGWLDCPIHERADLVPGTTLEGPALVLDRRSSYVVDPGWSVEVDGAGVLVCRRAEGRRDRCRARGEVKAVQEELFRNRFVSLVDEAGRVLERTALSTNVKHRLDFSCGLLDPQGRLVVNAPHIPVHLGAMGLCVRAVREVIEMREGDIVVTNHPAFGGAHLPDVTVITPVFDDARPAAHLGYVASRAHHAEIGGTRPGSMPPRATRLIEEGVVLSPTHLVRADGDRFDAIERALSAGPWPSRAVADNLADLGAAVAANHRAAEGLRRLAGRHGSATVFHHMEALRLRAERLVREAIGALADGRYEACEHLDDGSPLRVRIDVRGEEAVFDFSGSADTHPGNLNATPAIVGSAVMYVLRLLLEARAPDAPLNEGLMAPVRLRIPSGILSPEFGTDPAEAPAVVGGNVETSQRLVDLMLQALRLAACSQGTMNNVLFGNPRFGYYETVCGGAGAGPGFDGADAVQTHMTNTRLTDPELLEQRYPVIVERFAVRRGSGGGGRHRGGDGVVRRLRFLEPMELSVLGQHRREGPYGLAGGAPGAPGAQRVVRANGDVIELGSIDGCAVDAGDRLELETPGGGGWGEEAISDQGNPEKPGTVTGFGEDSP